MAKLRESDASYRRKVATQRVFKAMVNSFIIAVPATFLSVYFSTLTAYGIHICDFKLKKAAWSFILAVMIVPGTISAIGFYRFMLKLNLLDTY